MLYNPIMFMSREYDRHYAWWRMRFTSDTLGYSCIGRTVEVSMKGLSFHCDYDIPLSTNGKVTVFMPPCDYYPQPYEFNADTKSIYSILQGESGFLIGLEFTDIHEDGATVMKIKLASCPMVPGSEEPPAEEKDVKAFIQGK